MLFLFSISAAIFNFLFLPENTGQTSSLYQVMLWKDMHIRWSWTLSHPDESNFDLWPPASSKLNSELLKCQIMKRYGCYLSATRGNDSSQHEVSTLFFLSNFSLCGLLWMPGEPWAQKAACRTGATGHTWSVLCVLPLFMHGSEMCDVCCTAHPVPVHLQLLVRSLFFLHPSLKQYNLPKQSQSA